MVKSIQDSRKLLKALGDLSEVTVDVEEHFTDELHVFFQYLGRKMLSNVDLDQPLDAIFYQQVDSVIDEYWKEYDEILSAYVDKAYQVGIVHSKLLLSASKDYAKRYESLKSENKELFFKPNAKVSKRLKTYKFEASEHTKSRVTDEINKTLGEAYREGWGRENVTKRIQQKFNDLATWESRRIAVTEVNSARNLAHYNQLIEDNIAYHKWIPSKDEKVRDSHKMHPKGVGGEIVPVGERFSNGLLRPGDKEGGPIKEWVNCRCTTVAFIIPLGYEAPSFFPFFEEDLVKVGSTDPKDYLNLPSETIETVEIIPSVEESAEEFTNPANLTKGQAQAILDFHKRHKKHKIEYGNIIDLDTGELFYDTDVRGVKHGVRVHRPSSLKNFGVIHNHPEGGTFSGGDISNMLEHRGQSQCYAITPKGKVHVATITDQAKFQKERPGLSFTDNTIAEYKYGLHKIARETSQELMDKKYRKLFDKCKTREEVNEIRRQMREEFVEIYDKRVYEKYSPGKDLYIEIHEYSLEELEYVIRNSN